MLTVGPGTGAGYRFSVFNKSLVIGIGYFMSYLTLLIT